MKLNIELKDMNYSECLFKTDYVETISSTYSYVFKSNHGLSIYTLADNSWWMGSFYAPNGKSGDLPMRRTPEEVFNYFKDLFEKNDVRKELINGFEE